MNTNRRTRRSAEAMYPVIESYLESGLTQKQFYQQHDLARSVFIYWLRHYRKSKQISDQAGRQPGLLSEASHSGHFLPLTADPPVSCQFSLSGGVRVRIEGLSETRAASVLTALLGL